MYPNALHIQEHYQMLLVTALGISRAVATPPQLVGPGQLANVLVDYHVLTGLEDLKKLLAERGIDARFDKIESLLSGDKDLLKGLAVKMRLQLFQHLPEMRIAVGQWASDWQRFRDEKAKLVTEIASVLAPNGRNADMTDLASIAVGKVLGIEVGDAGQEDPQHPDLNLAVDQARFRSDGARHALAIIKASVAVCRGPLADALSIGRSPGRCPSCPGDTNANTS
jgi:hypothetical protein